jgi:glycosyltransferase involved in cell wall biosynthesis
MGAFGPPPVPARSVGAVRAALGVAGAPLVVCVARYHPQKGLDTLIDAVGLARQQLPALRLALVGEGPLEAQLRDQVHGLDLDGAVAFVAPANPADELAAADVVAIPSRWESGPLVLREAVTLGRPVIATPVGEIPAVIDNGSSGWVVPVDDPAALAAALVEALQNPDEARRRAGEARVRLDLAAGDDAKVSVVEAAYRASLGRR